MAPGKPMALAVILIKSKVGQWGLSLLFYIRFGMDCDEDVGEEMGPRSENGC